MRRRIAVDLAAAFVLSLLGGYCFAFLWRVTTFDTKRAEGHHLYFRAALYGAMLFALALCLRTLLALNSLAYLNFDSALVEYVRPALKTESGLAWIAKCPNPTREPVAVTLLPMLSGNRNAQGRITLTTDYDAVYSDLRGNAARLGLPADWESEIQMQIRTDEIVTAALFSEAIYTKFNPEWQQHIVEPKNQPPVVQVLSSMGTNLRLSGPM